MFKVLVPCLLLSVASVHAATGNPSVAPLQQIPSQSSADFIAQSSASSSDFSSGGLTSSSDFGSDSSGGSFSIDAAEELEKCNLPQYPADQYFGKNFVGPIPPESFNVTPARWTQKENPACVFQGNTIKDQFQTDVVMWFNTMFKKAQVVGGKALKEKHIVKLKETQNFLKRLFLLMAYAPMHYVTKKNASAKDVGVAGYQQPLPFAFPLASALSHGQRILMTLVDAPQGKGMDKAVYNLLLSGDASENPIIDELRSFASHGVSQAANGKLVEEKLKVGFMGAIQGDHHMVNVPLGGVGNKNELGYFIGPEGQSYEPGKDTSVSNYQLGHVFIAAHRFSGGISSLLLGVESTAPHKSSPFAKGGKTHSIKSGFEDATTARSSAGGQKWQKLLGGLAPASYGGMLVTVEKAWLGKLKVLFDTVLSWSEDEQKALFVDLLSMNASEANQLLRQNPKLAAAF